MKSKEDIVRQFAKHKAQSDRGLTKQYKNTSRCQAFEAGDFMDYRDKVQFQATDGRKKRAFVQFNKVKPYIAAVKGFLAQNRRKPKYIARIPNQVVGELYSKYANSLSDYVRDNCNASQVETHQDGDMLICGYGAVETALTYGDGYASRDPNGEIIMGRIDPMTCWWDASARASNLLDARWVGVTKQYHVDEAKALFADSNEEDFEAYDPDNRADYQFLANGGVYDKFAYDWNSEEEGMVNVHFYQWYEVEKYYRADNPIYKLTNPLAAQATMIELELIARDSEDLDPRAEIIAFDEATKTKLQEIFAEFIEPKEFRRKVYYTAVISGKTCFTAFKSQSQEGFSLKFKTGDYDAKNKLWTGMVNSLMEPTLYYNKALTELMFTIAANSKGGVFVEDDAVEDITEFEQNYARTDAVVVVKSGSLGAGKILQKASPAVPTGLEQIVGISDAALADVSGIDKTFLGSSENRTETAMLQRQRIRQVTSVLACYFDSVSLYQKEHARLMLDFLRVFAENNRGALYRVLGERGAVEFVQISEDKLAAEFDVYIDEAPQTPEEKAEYVAIISQMADRVRATGDVKTANLLDSIAVKYLPIDKEDVQQIQEALNPQQEPVDPAYVQQLEQMIQQLQGQAAQVQLEKVASDTQLNLAKVEKTKADVQKSAADTLKTLEEADQTSVETQAILDTKNDVRVII